MQEAGNAGAPKIRYSFQLSNQSKPRGLPVHQRTSESSASSSKKKHHKSASTKSQCQNEDGEIEVGVNSFKSLSKNNGQPDEVKEMLERLETLPERVPHSNTKQEEPSRTKSLQISHDESVKSRALFDDIGTSLEFEDDEILLFDIENGDFSPPLTDDDRRTLYETLISTEFPVRTLPTAHGIIKTCTHNAGARKNGASYCPGDWAEILGTDMKWRLEMVTRVIKQVPDDWDWNDPDNKDVTPDWTFLYRVGNGRNQRMLDAHDIRVPEEGLRRIFGCRPWLWQQWALLKLENELRFQKDHQNDFISKDVRKYAAVLWEGWLNLPSNVEFKDHFEDDRIGDIGRRELVHHIMKPFDLIDEVKEGGEGSIWNFAEDNDISVYTYLAILGSGFPLPLVIFLIQIAIPFILLASVSGGEAEEQGADAKAMVFVVMVLYILKVVPDTVLSFTRTVGITDSLYARLQSLQDGLWSNASSSVGQMIGYKADIYMNTVYTSLLYMLNIVILYTIDDPFEVLLNALAVEFVFRLDEEFTRFVWWDPKKRWLIAGTIEIIIRRTLLLESLSSPKLFLRDFAITPDVVIKACDGDCNLLHNNSFAVIDNEDTKFMTKAEVTNYQCLKVAIDLGNRNAVREYEKPLVTFGRIERILFASFGAEGFGLFDKHSSYRTWSRWERILSVAPIPDLDTIFDTKKNGIHFLKENLKEITPSEELSFANYNPNEFQNFLWHFFDVISLKFMCRGLKFSWKERKYTSFFFRLIDGVLQWVGYCVQIIFPVVAIVAPFLVFRKEKPVF